MTDVIDLDALTPQKAILKFQGNEITVDPPTVGAALKLAAAAQRMADLKDNAADIKPDELDSALDDIKEKIDVIIPELKGHELNMEQLLVVTRAISDMLIPKDAKELKERGISVDSDPKAD
jgi:hypothetical protein